MTVASYYPSTHNAILFVNRKFKHKEHKLSVGDAVDRENWSINIPELHNSNALNYSMVLFITKLHSCNFLSSEALVELYEPLNSNIYIRLMTSNISFLKSFNSL